MQPVAPPPGIGMASFKYGAIFGVVLGFLQIGTLYLTGYGLILGFILTIGAWLGVGILPARETGRVAAGAIAGLWLGLFSGIIFSIGMILYVTNVAQEDFIQQMMQTDPSITADAAAGGLLIVLFVFGFILLIIDLGGGAGLGALGGLIGKAISPYKHFDNPPYPPYPPQQYPPTAYPPHPAPGSEYSHPSPYSSHPATGSEHIPPPPPQS